MGGIHVLSTSTFVTWVYIDTVIDWSRSFLFVEVVWGYLCSSSIFSAVLSTSFTCNAILNIYFYPCHSWIVPGLLFSIRWLYDKTKILTLTSLFSFYHKVLMLVILMYLVSYPPCGSTYILIRLYSILWVKWVLFIPPSLELTILRLVV